MGKVGVSCQVIKNRENEIERIEAPNGSPSSLYDNAKRLLGSEEKALEVWAKAYTPGFIAYYGHWNNPAPGEFFNTDENGEPLLDDVLQYMKRETYLLEPFAKEDVKDVRDVIMSTHAGDISSLSNIILQSFYVDGHIILNEANLRRSGLYDETEISRILSDPSVMNKVASSMRDVIDYTNNVHDREKEAYFLSGEKEVAHIIYREGEFNRFGKKVPYNPDELYDAMRDRVGGIKSRSEFEQEFETLRDEYPELVERFIADKEFASSMYDEFSPMTVVPVVDIENGDAVPGKKRTLSKLQDFSYYNASAVDMLRNQISAFLNREEVTEDEARTMVRSIEETATSFGIDIIGASESPSMQNLEDLMLYLDIYVSRQNDPEYAEPLAIAIDNVFGDSTARKVLNIPSNMDGRQIFYSETALSDTEMFENYSLLRVGQNLYQRISRVDVNRLYTSAAKLAKANLQYFPVGIYPDSCFQNGVLDSEKVKNVDEGELSESIRQYVLSLTDSRNTEEMVMNRIAFGNAPRPFSMPVDVQREFDRYMNRKSEQTSDLPLFHLYSDYLNNKLRNTERYRNAYRYLDFKPGPSLGLTTTDPNTLKQMELSLDGEARDRLFDYAMNSQDPTIRNLFYLPSSNMMYAGQDFRHYLHTRHPEMLDELSGVKLSQKEDTMIAEGVYDDFVRVDNAVLMKIGESSSGSLYKHLTGTESEVIYDSTQRVKETDIDYAPYRNRSGLEQDMKLSKEESKKLDNLECDILSGLKHR